LSGPLEVLLLAARAPAPVGPPAQKPAPCTRPPAVGHPRPRSRPLKSVLRSLVPRVRRGAGHLQRGHQKVRLRPWLPRHHLQRSE
jgi:hypothetical protein